jgi:ABC-type multidrug transport system fused ATPase/permease subunit
VRLPDDAKGKISFKNVTFFYPSRPHKASLEKLSLEIVPGKITAIVGESGAGKSTVLQLLLRFYNAQSGSITFDNTAINNIELESLRSQFAYVSQEPIVFSATVWDNVVYGKPDASLAEVESALKQAAAFDFVAKLPQGVHAYLGEKGVRLSTGQKQRLIIARAFLKNPKILLFDEATSALDSGNEQLVQQATEKLMLHRTTVVIAHRLSTIRNADKIVVMGQGKVLEQGSHDTLMALRGEYYRLARLQQDCAE